MRRKALLEILESAGLPRSMFTTVSDADLHRYAEGPARHLVKDAEAGRIREFVGRNLAQFKKYGQTPGKVVAAFRSSAECFAEDFTDGAISKDEAGLGAGPDYSSTGDLNDTPRSKQRRQQIKADSTRTTDPLSPGQQRLKQREAEKVFAWAQQNAEALAKTGSTPEKVRKAFLDDPEFVLADQWVGH